jgi:hypothetical protein
MIRRRFQRKTDEAEVVAPKGFDDYETRLGDLMRGERATLGKSLLDVQRELRIKASYVAAIENADPTAFDTPGFIAGYVRSYARYLGLDPDKTFAAFCRESGFSVAHGMSAQASGTRRNAEVVPTARHGLSAGHDPFKSPNLPFIPEQESLLSRIEPRALGSALVLMLLIGSIGYGGWSVLKEVQQVQLAPVEQAPVVLSDLDPLAGAALAAGDSADNAPRRPGAEALDRLYRPQALEVPVLVSRDAPISTLDPRSGGSFQAPDLPQQVLVAGLSGAGDPVPQVVEAMTPSLTMVAVRPSWVRVSAVDGSVIFEGIMDGGQSWEVPMTEEVPLLRSGESGAVYFVVNGEHYGPVGTRGMVTSNVALSIDAVTERFAIADIAQDGDLARIVAEATITPAGQ